MSAPVPQHAVAVIGGGPAGLMAAEVLARGGVRVTVYDRMPSLGRKFLMAGRGGLNLTHSEDFEAFVERYGEAAPRLEPMLEAFPPAALVAWANGLGQETFIGSSGRVFPRAMKASPLLRAWLARLAGLGVALRPGATWRGWDEQGRLLIESGGEIERATADAMVLALGGGSWPRLGSDGAWTGVLEGQGVPVSPLRPANSGFAVAWSPAFAERFAGQPLKRIALEHVGRRVRGEAMVTRTGLEGGAVYALSAAIRATVERDGAAPVTIDLRPDMTVADLHARLDRKRGRETLANFLRKAAGLSALEINLLRESHGVRLSEDAAQLAGWIKAAPLALGAPSSLERAISTAGGVAWDAVDEGLMLKARPGVFLAGEMLDWEAPTGGYLLQMAFATGAWAGRAALQRLGLGDPETFT